MFGKIAFLSWLNHHTIFAARIAIFLAFARDLAVREAPPTRHAAHAAHALGSQLARGRRTTHLLSGELSWLTLNKQQTCCESLAQMISICTYIYMYIYIYVYVYVYVYVCTIL